MVEEQRLRVFQNVVLRKMLARKWEEVARGCKKLHNKKCRNWCSSLYVITVIKTGRMRWAEHVARMGEGKFLQGFAGKTRMNDTVSNSHV
jgi:hypothetical protein